MERTALYRDTFPRTNENGANFRTEVCVCSACHAVYRHVPAGFPCLGTTGRKVPRRQVVQAKYAARMSEAKLDELVAEPCDGRAFPPTTNVGLEYRAGRRLP